MKHLLFWLLMAILPIMACNSAKINKQAAGKKTTDTMQQNEINAHQFIVEGIDGENINLADFAGKKILIVNTASECGYTPQYAGLQELYTKYNDNLVVIGCPCNQFGKQESGSAASIAKFCQKNYGVSFPLTAKLDVKGADQAPLYQWLTSVSGKTPKWNFCKYLIDEKGNFVAYYPSAVKPTSEQLLKAISQ